MRCEQNRRQKYTDQDGKSESRRKLMTFSEERGGAVMKMVKVDLNRVKRGKKQKKSLKASTAEKRTCSENQIFLQNN